MVPLIKEDHKTVSTRETASDIAQRLGNTKLNAILMATKELDDEASKIFNRLKQNANTRNIR